MLLTKAELEQTKTWTNFKILHVGSAQIFRNQIWISDNMKPPWGVAKEIDSSDSRIQIQISNGQST